MKVTHNAPDEVKVEAGVRKGVAKTFDVAEYRRVQLIHVSQTRGRPEPPRPRFDLEWATMLLDRLSRPVRGVRIVQRGALSTSDTDYVQIIPMRQLDRGDVERLLEHVGNRDGGHDLIVTSALSERERAAFIDVGFVERESLHLLTHGLRELPLPATPATQVKLRSGRRTDLAAVLSIDNSSFDGFWAMDREALNAARKATPIHRYVVATIKNQVVGYAITGRSGSATFLQRLGVDPDVRRQGLGSRLVIDALQWARENGGRSMLVNTQASNHRALSLYEHLGFELAAEQLKVLEWSGHLRSAADVA